MMLSGISSEQMLHQLAILEPVPFGVIGCARYFSEHSTMRHHRDILVAILAEFFNEFGTLLHTLGAVFPSFYRVWKIVLNVIQVEAGHEGFRLLPVSCQALFESLLQWWLEEGSLPIHLFSIEKTEVHMWVTSSFTINT
jgi:hypothetical protein